MNRPRVGWIVFGTVALLATAGVAGLLSLPVGSSAKPPVPLPLREVHETIDSLAPTKRDRPVIAIVGINDATELTDYLMPYGILRRADIAEVVAVSTQPGPITLYPAALSVEPDETIDTFDVRYPDGADYVIVPAMSRDDDPFALEWIKGQAAKGAIVIGVCVGAKVVAAAGLLDGRRATSHWYVLPELLDRHPTIEYVPDRRLVVDGRIATTTGITASMPLSLTLIEAIAGRDKAAAVARDLGVTHWDARHTSEAFQVSRSFAIAAIRNRLAFWQHEELGIPLEPGVDEVTLALVADAWSRTYRSQAVLFAATPDSRPTRGGLRILPGRIGDAWPDHLRLAMPQVPPAQALDLALDRIADRYGLRTAEFVAAQLEYAL